MFKLGVFILSFVLSITISAADIGGTAANGKAVILHDDGTWDYVGGGDPKSCKAYANNAIAQQRLNQKRGCGFAGEHWHLNYNKHYNWCLTITPTLRSQHTKSRQNALARCNSPVKKPQGSSAGISAASDRDYVSNSEQYRKNGKIDAVFQASINAPNQVITGIEVRNTNGQRSIWDTYPNNSYWLGVAVVDGRAINNSDGSVNFSLGQGQKSLRFYTEDNGSVRGGKTDFRMTISFASGDKLVITFRRNNSNTTTSTYLGCFIDKPDRDFKSGASTGSKPMTNQGCISACREKGFSIAATQFSSYCYCGNSYGRYGKAPSNECNSPCSGNAKEKCGGSWRNSVYKTGK